MKYLVTSLVLLISVIGFSQSKSMQRMVVKETTKVENVSVSVTVDSAAEIESAFRVEDIKELLESADANQIVSFKIICNGDITSDGVKSHISYKIDGNSNDIETFLMGIEKIKSSALKYYKNKK